MVVNTFYKFLILLFVAGIAGIYLFIPSPIKVSSQINIKPTEANMFSFLSDENNWRRLQKNDSNHLLFKYSFANKNYPFLFINAETPNRHVKIKIEILDTGKPDSNILSWLCEIPAGTMPWNRVQTYKEAKRLKKDFSKVIQCFVDYTNQPKNMYGINITETKLQDTIVATLSRTVLKPPSASLACMMINELRQKINNAGLSETGFPMTLIQQVKTNNYKIMVGLPVNKTPEPGNTIVIKKMVPGKLLTGIVYGGPAAIGIGHEQMRNFISDENREQVALPYEISVVNKCTENDTTKWITKICYPVF